MKVLVTGSSGFLGKEVVKVLDKKKYNLTFITRRKKRKKNYIFCNLADLKKLKIVLKESEPDAIINLAAEVSFKQNTKNMYKINSHCPYEIAKYCKKKKFTLSIYLQ